MFFLLVFALQGGAIALSSPARPADAASAATLIEIGRGNTSKAPLSIEQINNLVLLGKVWGFVKYHHPAIASGKVDADSELNRVLPSLLNARTRASAASLISSWISRLEMGSRCSQCALAPHDVQLQSDIAWISDRRTLGATLSGQLLRIYQNRPAESTQHYVAFVPGVGNPDFTNEREYPQALPAVSVRILALYRFWNIVEYWFPYRNLIPQNWDVVLREFVPRVWMSTDADSYRLTMLALIARVGDGHVNLENVLSVRPPRGGHRLPVKVRFIEGKAVVTGFSHEAFGPASGLRAGDVLVSIDGARVDSLIKVWAPYYAASNQSARLRDIARFITRGPPGRTRVTIERNGSILDVHPERIAVDRLDEVADRTNDLPGETFRLLTKDVAYLKLSSASSRNSADYIERASGTKVLVIDIRNYPKDFMVFALGGHLVDRPTAFARFTTGDAANPGAFVWTSPIALQPVSPTYTGRIVILVDESSQSQAEYTALAFRSAPGALVAGSTTAGADGNVSPITLPGGLRSRISGIGVFYPDRRPTQQVGIVPDIVVHPTISGIRQGRDEVLEVAVSRALGKPFRLPAGLR